MPVVSMSCPKCKKEATEYDEGKWKCLHCGIKFLYEKPVPEPSIYVQRGDRPRDALAEKTLLDFGAYKVTTVKVLWGDSTFPIANITSVTRAKLLPVDRIVLGCILLLTGFASFFSPGGLAGIFFGSIMFGVGALFLYQNRKPLWKLEIVTNGGTKRDLVSRDAEGVREFDDAIHKAMAVRG